MQDAITSNYSPVYRYLRLRSLLPSSSEPPLIMALYCILPPCKYTASFPSHMYSRRSSSYSSHHLYAATIALYSPPGPVFSPLPTLLSLNSPRFPLARPRTPAPRSSGRFRHQILHSTTPGLPLKPPRSRLSCVYNISALCFYGIVSRRLVPIAVRRVCGESVLEPLLTISQLANHLEYY